MKSLWFLLAVVVACGFSNFFASSAHAQQQGVSSQVGMVFGVSVPDLANSNPHQLVGIKGAAYVSPTISLGGYYIDPSDERGAGGIPLDVSYHGLEGAYHMPTANGDTYLALRYGLTKVYTQQNGASLIFSPYHFGLAAGHDFAVTSWASVGFEGCMMRVQDSKTTLPGASTVYQIDSFNSLSFILSLQLKF